MICFDCIATMPPISEPSMCWPRPSRWRTYSADAMPNASSIAPT